jgi:hypothetical protein
MKKDIAAPCLFQFCVPSGIPLRIRRIQRGTASGIPRNNATIFSGQYGNEHELPWDV